MTALPVARDPSLQPRTVRRASAYARLGDRLAACPPGQDELVLRFAEIEQTLGRALPDSAQHVSFWTARSQTGIGRALRRSGFHAELIVDERGPAVRFTRQGAHLTPAPFPPRGGMRDEG